jgi:hypothetical protein
VRLEVFSNTFDGILQSFICSTIPRLGACALLMIGFSMLIHHTSRVRMNIKNHLSVMSAGQKRRLPHVLSLLFTFLILFSEERYRTLLHCLRQVKDIAIDSFTGLVCSQSSFHMLMRKFKHYIIWNIYLQRSCVCLAVLLRASHRSNSYFHYSSRFQQATVSTTCSSFVLLSSTSAVHFHDPGL